MRTLYLSPECEIILFAEDDVLTRSKDEVPSVIIPDAGAGNDPGANP